MATWQCVYCGKGGFKSKKDASVHESSCKINLKNKNPDSWKTLLGIVGLIILILIIFVIPFLYSTLDDYSDCVDYCVQDHDFCVLDSTVYDKNMNGYILDGDYNGCFDDLDLCVLDCAP